MGLKVDKYISAKDVLSKVNDAEIFTHYFGEFEIRRAYSSVFRKDAHPSTGFYVNRHDKIIYSDLSYW